MKDWSLRVAFLVFAASLLVTAAVRVEAVTYIPGPPITGKIHLEDGEKWAHMNDESEWCSIELYDTSDKDCELPSWTVVEDFYWEADFDGGEKGYCEPATDASHTHWFATGTGTSVVTATLKDYPTIPSPNANDPDVVITLGQNPVNGDFCAGFKVKLELNVNGDFALQNIVCEEGQTWSGWQHGFWSNWVSVVGTSNTITADSTQKGITITATFKTIPSDAEPRKNIKAKLRYKPAASWEYQFCDDDIDDGDGYFGVSLAFILGISYTWDLRDYDEGAYAGVWTYEADGVGSSRQPGTPDFADCTSNYAESSLPYSGSNSRTGSQMEESTGAGYASRPKNGQCVSTYAISVGVSAVGNDEDNWSKGRIKFDDSWFYIDEVKY